LNKLFLYIAIFIFFNGGSCSSPTERIINKAIQLEQNTNYLEAKKLYERALEHCKKEDTVLPECLIAVDKIVDLSLNQFREPQKALYWLNYKMIWSNEISNVIGAQKLRMRIFLDYLSQYNQAVVEAEKILNIDSLSLNDRCEIVLELSTAHFQLRQFNLAEKELASCLGNIPIEEPLKEKLIRIEIDLLLAQKKNSEAIDRIKYAIGYLKNDQDIRGYQSMLSLLYEQTNNPEESSKLLKALIDKSSGEEKNYYQTRLERLKLHTENLPGAKFKKRLNRHL